VDCGVYGAEYLGQTLATKPFQIPFEGAHAILH